MYFGQTDEEIYENVKVMNALANKVARIVRIGGVILAVLVGIIIAADSVGLGMLIMILGIVAAIFGLGITAKNLTWGWIWYKGKHNAKNLGSDMADIAKENLTVAYLIGGRSGTKWSLIGMIATLMGVIAIGSWVGTYYRWKFEPMEKKLAKKLGK